MKKKFSATLSMLLVLCMLLSLTSSPAFAEEAPPVSSEIGEDENALLPEADNSEEGALAVGEVLVETSFAEAPLFTTDEMMTLAQGEFPFIESEIGFSPSVVCPQEQWVPLYDMNNTVFAYWIPVANENGTELGYLTVGALQDGFAKYAWSTDLAYLNEMRTQLEEPGTTMVFMPPMNYVLKQAPKARNGRSEYVRADSVESMENVTDMLLSDTESLQVAYDLVRNEEARQRNDVLLNPLAPTPRTDWDRRLQCEWDGDYDFVNIYDSDNDYGGHFNLTYGGNQNWWMTSGNRCGPVAATNTMYYMSTQDWRFDALWPHSGLDKVTFMDLGNTMYDYISPAAYGELDLVDYSKDVERYCADQGVTMWSFPVFASDGKDRCIEVILDGLGWNSPVSVLNTAKFTPFPYEFHWMTITKYFSLGAKAWVAVSTWGRRESIDFHTLFTYVEYANLGYSGGFTYFRAP